MAEWASGKILGSSFITHSGPNGYEVHFSTPDREKYLAVQEECRKQIGHEKPMTNKDCPLAKAFDRLAAYEDTGLEPEICAEYKKFEDEAVSKNVPFSRIVELMEADSEGHLLVLPCKVGDTVYWIKGKAILEVYIQWFETNAYGWCACGTYPPMATPTFRFADFGKTVFLTRAAAEAALEKEETSDGVSD